MSYVSENLEVLSGIAKCVAKEFGMNCEVVVHDLTLPYDSTIVAIENGYITGRKIGDSGTNTGLEVLRNAMSGEAVDTYNYINHSKKGRVLRSSSHYIRNAAGEIIGSFCINFDISELVVAQKNIQYLAFMDGGDDTRELFTGNVDELLQTLMADSMALVGKPISEMNKDDKVQAIRYLDAKGAFLIKKSVETVSEFYGISKFTLYNYLNEGHEKPEGED
ncbi:MAG: helix-turn-helix transcriptional regulator [Deferribacteraceae bacterium]|nr:helix-turn-helix transcriptional regulator [Deferribacteraceae bacterium]